MSSSFRGPISELRWSQKASLGSNSISVSPLECQNNVEVKISNHKIATYKNLFFVLYSTFPSHGGTNFLGILLSGISAFLETILLFLCYISYPNHDDIVQNRTLSWSAAKIQCKIFLPAASRPQKPKMISFCRVCIFVLKLYFL